MARENLDIVVIVFANRAYRILDFEFARLGCAQSAQADRLFSLADPVLAFPDRARGMGVAATSCSTIAEFETALAAALNRRGPSLIEAVVN